MYEENKASEELLKATRQLLDINNNKSYRLIPKTLQICSIKEITSEAIANLEQLNIELDKTISFARLLEDLRKEIEHDED